MWRRLALHKPVHLCLWQLHTNIYKCIYKYICIYRKHINKCMPLHVIAIITSSTLSTVVCCIVIVYIDTAMYSTYSPVLNTHITHSGICWYHHCPESLLPAITFVITKVIAGNIALSLGMIGALSIVRFRNPVKSSLELTIYFLLMRQMNMMLHLYSG